MDTKCIRALDISNNYTVTLSGEPEKHTIYWGVVSVSNDADISMAIHIAHEFEYIDVRLLCITKGKQLVRISTQQNHTIGQARSVISLLHIGYDASTFSFNGMISIAQRADGSDAYQKSQSLLMDPSVRAIHQPQLEILANDVRCTHGSVTTYLDSEQLWYCQSRGICIDDAKTLLIRGKIDQLFSGIPDSEYARYI